MLRIDTLRNAAVALLFPLAVWAQETRADDAQIAEDKGKPAIIPCPDLIKKANEGTLTSDEWPLLNACFSNSPLAPPGIGQGTVAINPDLPGRGDPYGLSTFGAPSNGMVDG